MEKPEMVNAHRGHLAASMVTLLVQVMQYQMIASLEQLADFMWCVAGDDLKSRMENLKVIIGQRIKEQ